MPDTNPFIYDSAGIMILLVTLALVPFVAMMVTSFIKLVVVMNLLRQAMGLQQVPPNMVLNGLAIVLTIYIMAPTLQESIQRVTEANTTLEDRKAHPDTFKLPPSMQPFAKKQSSDWLANLFPAAQTVRNKADELGAIFNYVKQPLTDFLTKHSTPKHSAFFKSIARKLWPKAYLEDLDDSSLLLIVPSFVLSELTAAFEIGFLIYLPFIVIDLVVSNVLLAMGMMMVSPMTISLPFKLMLFVLVNGWDKIVEALALTYR